MARLVSQAAGGNLLDAIWHQVDANSVLDSEANTTSITTSQVNSQTFVPAANEVDAVLIKVASRASSAGSPTLTVHLRNTTTGTNVLSKTINVTDIPVEPTFHGWLCVKFDSTHTPNGTDSYAIGLVVSGATPSVTVYRSSTAGDWARMLRRTSKVSPSAGDIFTIVQEKTGAGTNSGALTVTMNSTSNTDYGSTSGLTASSWVNCHSIGDGCTLGYPTTASINSILRLTGALVVQPGGTLRIGSESDPIPRSSTAILEFTNATAVTGGIYARRGATIDAWGQSRTSGKNITWTLLTADLASSGTSVTVADDTGWLSGDEIALSGTRRGSLTDAQTTTLASNAGASSLSLSAGSTQARKGDATTGLQAAVGLLTRNVTIRSTTLSGGTNQSFLYGDTDTVIRCEWVRFDNLGRSGSGNERSGPMTSIATTGTIRARYCAFANCEMYGGPAALGTWNGGTLDWRYNVVYRTTAGQSAFQLSAITSLATGVIDNNCIIRGGTQTGYNLAAITGLTFTNNRAYHVSTGIEFSTGQAVATPTAFSGNAVIGCSSTGITLGSPLENFAAGSFIAALNGGTGVNFSSTNGAPFYRFTWTGMRAFGNTTQNVQLVGSLVECIFRDAVIAGDTNAATGTGVVTTNTGGVQRIRWDNCVFGGSGGTLTTHSTADVNGTGGCLLEWTFLDCEFLSTTEIASGLTAAGGANARRGSFLAFSKKDGTAATHETIYPQLGTISRDSSVFNTDAPSEKLTPTSATIALRSTPVRVPVNSGNTVTIAVAVRKDGSYNGSVEPKLYVRANPALGIDSDTLLDTLTASANTWETLGGTTAAAAADGVVEFYVEVFGTAGNVYVDDWS